MEMPPAGAAVWCARDAGFQFGAGEGEGQRTKPASKMARRPPIAKITGGEREIREQREWMEGKGGSRATSYTPSDDEAAVR